MHKDTVPTYGLLMINHAYNEGRITFKQWLEQSREWALKMKEQYACSAEPRASRPTRPLTPSPPLVQPVRLWEEVE